MVSIVIAEAVATRQALAFRMRIARRLHDYAVTARMAALMYRDGLKSTLKRHLRSRSVRPEADPLDSHTGTA
jgi:signal transduction histidine kinase